MERYFEAFSLRDKATKGRITTLYLTDTTTLWWRRRFTDMEKGLCNIDTRDVFKREIMRQFYPENVAYQAQRRMKCLKHIGSIQEYVKEFSALMLEIPNVDRKTFSSNSWTTYKYGPSRN